MEKQPPCIYIDGIVDDFDKDSWHSVWHSYFSQPGICDKQHQVLYQVGRRESKVWRKHYLRLQNTGYVWGFSDTSNDLLCLPLDLREVSVTHQTTLFEFHRTCLRSQWHIKRLYLNFTRRVWVFSDTSNDFIGIPQDVREVSVTNQTTLLAFHRTCVRFQ